MSTFLLVHGAWHGGWCWDGVADRLRAAGHVALAPTLLGLAERQGELEPGIGLAEHAELIAEAVASRLTRHPLRTFEQAIRLTGAVDRVPGLAILCRDPFGLGFDRFVRELGYPSVRLDAGHDAMLTEPAALAGLLLDAIADGAGR